MLAFVAADEGLHQWAELAEAGAIDDGGRAQHRVDEKGRIGPAHVLALFLDRHIGHAREAVAPDTLELVRVGHIGHFLCRTGSHCWRPSERDPCEYTPRVASFTGRMLRHGSSPCQVPSVVQIGYARREGRIRDKDTGSRFNAATSPATIGFNVK